MAKKKAEKMQSEIVDSAHKIWLAGLGALASAEEEGSKVFKTLVNKGESLVSKGEVLIDKGEKLESRGKKKIEDTWGKVKGVRGAAEDTVEKVGDELDARVSSALSRIGVPTSSEIKRLTKRVEELSKKVDQLSPKATRKTPARKTAARKTAARKTATKKSA